MGRKPRTSFPGAIHHVFTRGVNRGDIFFDDSDREYFMGTLRGVFSDCGAENIAYCLMTNHFHLVPRESNVPLSSIMQRMLTSYSGWCNRKYGRTGHLFEDRYEANLCTTDAYLRNVIRYVHFNPVKAKLVTDPRDWKWSSASSYGVDASADPGDFDPWLRDETAALLNRSPSAEKQSLQSILDNYCRENGMEIGKLSLSTKEPRIIAAKKTISRLAIEHGHSMTSLARYLGVNPRAISRYCARD